MSMYETVIRLVADGLVVPVILMGAWALLFLIPNNKKYKAYCRILLAGITAYLFAKLIGSIYQPELQRPFELLGQEAGASFLDNPGFPSDHVLFCTAITLAVWFEVKQRFIAVTLAVLTLLVGVGRVLALVHSPLDVIGAIVIACVGTVWYFMREPSDHTPTMKQWSKPRKAGKV